MKEVSLALPVFAFVVGTRAALGAGIGLLVAEHLPEHRRRVAGATLAAIGVAATLPAAIAVIRGVGRARRLSEDSRARGLSAVVEQDDRLIGATRFARKGDDVF